MGDWQRRSETTDPLAQLIAAEYIPPIEKKASLPVVIVKNVRKELSALGIPA